MVAQFQHGTIVCPVYDLFTNMPAYGYDGNDIYLWCSKVPIKKLPSSQPVKYFSEDALKIILDQPDTNTLNGIRNLFYMILLYDTGARNQEILDLKVSDIHALEKILMFW